MTNKITMQLALARNTEYGYTVIQDYEELEYMHSGVVLITEPTSVEFSKLDQAVVQEAMIIKLMDKIKDDEARYEIIQAANQEKLDELRALPAPEDYE